MQTQINQLENLQEKTKIIEANFQEIFNGLDHCNEMLDDIEEKNQEKENIRETDCKDGEFAKKV